jgi:glycogen debranching enzyme
VARVTLDRGEDDIHSAFVPGIGAGARYGLRADGRYDPAQGFWFDPAKLLVDPYATAIDRPFAYDPVLAAAREGAPDTAPLMPKAIVSALAPPKAPPPPCFRPGGLIYEVPVRPFTMLHPEIPCAMRGTVGALAHPEILAHLRKIGVSAVELMPITAWIDERHLGHLGLTNGWGYNPVAMMALDPRLCPGAIAELRDTTAKLRAAGIGVILDVVFNHTGESDAHGPTLSLRGLDARAYFRHAPDGTLINDTGTGNTLACDHPATKRLVLDTLRHFVVQAGVDGFRFDLAPILGRDARGFDPHAALLREIIDDPLLGDRVLIAEPWDIGRQGYQLGNFPPPFLEWNDRYRDRVRRFWRGDAHALGHLATALAGSNDVFGPPATRSVSFIAAHDGFTLADLTAYHDKHNEANGENNRDGHGENLSWNNGHEGETTDAAILAARRQDARALLATLFATRGAIMLTAGDEFGRSQRGNNNAYAQDNSITWLEWAERDRDLEAHVARLADLRRAAPTLSDPAFLHGAGPAPRIEWLTAQGEEMQVADWEDPEGADLTMLLAAPGGTRLAVLLNRSHHPVTFRLPTRENFVWIEARDGTVSAPSRTVAFVSETPAP